MTWSTGDFYLLLDQLLPEINNIPENFEHLKKKNQKKKKELKLVWELSCNLLWFTSSLHYSFDIPDVL